MGKLDKKFDHYINMVTNKGKMRFKLLKENAPKNAASFSRLANGGFYNGLLFFLKVDDAYIQGGCPQNNGMGGPGYFVKCETDGKEQEHERGSISMAHTARDMNGSQFILCLDKEKCAKFDENNSCIGKMVDGEAVLDELEEGDKIEKVFIEVVEVIDDEDLTKGPRKRKWF